MKNKPDSELTHHQYLYRRGRTAGQKRKVLRCKKTLDFIIQHPAGVTKEDFKRAGVEIYGIDRLLKLDFITAEQVREPERGPRCFHWLWKMKGE